MVDKFHASHLPGHASTRDQGQFILGHGLIIVCHVSVHEGNSIKLDLPIAQSTFLAFIKSTRSKKLFL